MNSDTEAFLYKANCIDRVPVYPENHDHFTLEELQGMVGGFIEILDCGNWYMVVNEEGKLLGLPVNQMATIFFRQFHATVDFLVGDVLVCRKFLIL